jgi:hypothetical protein
LWSRQYGSADWDNAFYVATDWSGNVYSGGRTGGSLGGPSAGGADVFLAKHDSAGNLLWKKQWGTSGEDTRTDMWVDPQGNVYRAVQTTGALGGAHIGGYDLVVAKSDPMGNLLWEMQVGTSGDDDAVGGIWGDAQGNLYVGGSTTGSWAAPNAGSRDAYVIKLSPPDATASSSSLESMGADAALALSTDDVSVSTAPDEKSKRVADTSTDPSAISRRTNLQTSNLNLLAATTPAYTADDKDSNGDYASPTANTGAIDAAFATLENGPWPKIVAELSLEI